MKATVLTLLMVFLVTANAEVSDDVFAEEIKKANVINQLEQVAIGTLKQQQHVRYQMVMERLVTLRPQNTNYLFSLAKAYALQDNKSSAYNALVALQNAGFSYPFADNKDFDGIAGTEVYDYIEEGMVANGARYGEGQVVSKVPSQYSGMLFENMAYDSKSKRFLLGSIRSGEVFTLTPSGSFESFIKPLSGESETYGVVDLVIDQEKDLLWTSTASMPQYNGTNQSNFGQATISKYQLSTGKWLANISTDVLAKPLLFNALHLTKKGDLLFINPFSREMMTVAAASEQIKPVINLSQLTTVKAITSNDDATVLYVSDYEQGLFVINRASKGIKALNDPTKAFLSGIDDLFYSEGDLLAIQNQTLPSRIMRILLAEDVLFQGAVPIESSHPLATAITKGTVVGDDVYFFGNSQWSKMDMAGNLREGEQWDPLVIIKANGKYKMKEHLDTQKRMAEIKKKRGIQ